MPKKQKQEEKSEKWVDLREIKDLLRLLKLNSVQEFELEKNGVKIHIVTGINNQAESSDSYTQRGMVNPHLFPYSPHVVHPVPPPAPASHKETETAPAAEEETEAEDHLAPVDSPMVGSFYRAPSPDAPPYVEVGDEVAEETVLCIIEAMKLMNEIKAGMRGTVRKILVENGQPVEYGQALFLIEPLS